MNTSDMKAISNTGIMFKPGDLVQVHLSIVMIEDERQKDRGKFIIKPLLRSVGLISVKIGKVSKIYLQENTI